MILIIIYVVLCIWLYVYYISSLVIVSNHWNEDLKWLEKSKYPVIIYSKNPDSIHFKNQENTGAEATAYLKYIIDNYYNLPQYVAFIHGHENAWHHSGGNILELIERAKLYKHDYISLNFTPKDRSINEDDNVKLMKYIEQLWDEHFKMYLHRECPKKIRHDCCAQFIVSKKNILQYDISVYKHWYEMFKIELEEVDNKVKGKTMAAVFEFLWHIIYNEPDEVTYIMDDYFD